MFVLDSGVISGVQHCPPQLLVFDLNTDTLFHRYRFESSMYVAVASLFITPLVIVHDPPPKGRCRKLQVYIVRKMLACQVFHTHSYLLLTHSKLVCLLFFSLFFCLSVYL